jgi:predicted flap endonuclease-1-like 5' DNA nuclease
MDLAALVGGLLAGWLGEWVLDWLYWRRRKPAVALAGDDPAFAKKLESLEAENRDLKARLAVVPVIKEKVVHVERAHLQDIYGIGPVYAKRLKDAGISTFDELADANPKELIQIAKIQDWQVADPGSWVSQARDFADRRKESE